MKNILVAGASGHSKMIIDILEKNKDYNVIGFIDAFKPKGEIVYGHAIMGTISDIGELQDRYGIHGIIIGIGDNVTRMEKKEKIQALYPDLEFISAIHPSAILANDIQIPEGTVVMAGVIINSDAKIGRFCILNTNSSLGHDSVMEDFSSLASGATIGGNVKIGACTAICLKASVIHNITIGEHSVIGAGALVVKNVKSYKQAIGVPANNIRDREYDSKYLG